MQKGMKIIFQRIKEVKEKYYAAEMSHEVKSKIRLNI